MACALPDVALGQRFSSTGLYYLVFDMNISAEAEEEQIVEDYNCKESQEVDVALGTRMRVSSLGLSRFLSRGFLIREQIKSTGR